MASETTFGASIIKKPDVQRPKLAPSTASSDSITPSFVEKPVPPHSPFYQHPPASHERISKAKLPSKTALDINVVEKGFTTDSSELTPMTTRSENPFCSKISVDASNKECTMWPSRQTIVQTKMQDKKKKRASRFCACAEPRHHWDQLHKTHRLRVRLLIALILVGAMVGLGVGISKAVHGSYYAGNGASTTT